MRGSDTIDTKSIIRFEFLKFISLHDSRPRGAKRESRDPRTTFERWVSWGLLAWSLAAYVPFLAEQLRVAFLPVIYGAHSERQTATYSVAYNFAHSTWNYFLPRIDLRGPDETGIIPTEAPTYSYLCGLLMRAFGDSAAIGRLLNLAASTLALVMVAVVHLAKKRVAALAGFLAFWVTSPACSVEFRNYQPDGFMTSFAIMAACWFMIFAQSRRPVHFALGLASFTVACLSKPVVIGCAPAMVVFSLAEGPRRPPRQRWVVLLLMGIPPTLGLAWQWWATQIESHHSHVHWIDFGIRPATLRSNLANTALWKQSFFNVLPTWSNWYCWLLVGIGVCLSATKIFRARALGWMAWVAGTCIVLSTAADRIRVNCYYLTPLLPACAFFVSMAVEATVRKLSRLDREAFLTTWAAVALTSGSLAIVAWGHHYTAGESLPEQAKDWKRLEDGRGWALYCTAVRTCEPRF